MRIATSWIVMSLLTAIFESSQGHDHHKALNSSKCEYIVFKRRFYRLRFTFPRENVFHRFPSRRPVAGNRISTRIRRDFHRSESHNDGANKRQLDDVRTRDIDIDLSYDDDYARRLVTSAVPRGRLFGTVGIPDDFLPRRGQSKNIG